LIIGILAAVALPQYQVAVEKARMAEAMITLRSIEDAQKRYYLANGTYTTKVDELDVSFAGPITHEEYTIKLPSGISVHINGVSVGYIHAGNKAHTNTLVFYLNGPRFCHAKQNDKVANQVCKSLGGKNPDDREGCSIGSCTVYTL
ncbi:MAG: hypothetical protein MJ053_01825, partial [Elusimicrobiaceae bacterium]|nr:hypothetical protein [Elusimicrobiaceae bacterium]